MLLDTVKSFFSLEYADRGDLFKGLSIWREEKYKDIQGTYPVISISFANIKEKNFSAAQYKICSALTSIYSDYEYILSSGILKEKEVLQFKSISTDMPLEVATESLNYLAKYLARYYGKKPIILLDEYDTPIQEARINGYWNDISYLFRGLFNSTFKTNQWIERGLLTGITYVSKESMFSDVNNLQVVTVTTPLYTDCFGFTEEEVFSSMDEYNLSDKDKVKSWYDGFIFGGRKDIYNPWSILKYLSLAELDTYWADTSSNSFASDLIRQSNSELKIQLETLLQKKLLSKKLMNKLSLIVCIKFQMQF